MLHHLQVFERDVDGYLPPATAAISGVADSGRGSGAMKTGDKNWKNQASGAGKAAKPVKQHVGTATFAGMGWSTPDLTRSNTPAI